MRTHGWAGAVPATDEEAIERIVAATRSAIDEVGLEAGIADVARVLGVTRQTVYRYFPSTEALLRATAIQASGDFLDRVEARVAGIHDLSSACVEALAVSVESLPDEPYLIHLLASGNVEAFVAGATSSSARDLSRGLISRFDVDWASLPLNSNDLDELVELLVRLTESFVLDPSPRRTGKELRAWMRRWIAPAIDLLTVGS